MTLPRINNIPCKSAGNTQNAFRDDFTGASLDSNLWTVVQTGSGMSIALSGGYLTVSTGTTANAKTVIRSNVPVSLGVLVQFIVKLSQRIANQTFSVGLADMNQAQSLLCYLDGTTATNGGYKSCDGVYSTSLSTNTILTTASDGMIEFEAMRDECWFHSRSVNGSGVRVSSSNINSKLPDPNGVYYVTIIVENGGTAPASTTLLSIDAISCIDINEINAEIIASKGTSAGAAALPVIVIGQIVVTNAGVRYADSTTSLGASATFTGTSRNLGSTSYPSKFRALVYADQAGTLYLEQSADGSTWRTVSSTAVTAGGVVIAEMTCVLMYARVRYTNGGTAQGAFHLASIIQYFA